MRAAFLVAVFVLSLVAPATAARPKPWHPGDWCRVLPTGDLICGPIITLPDEPTPDPKPKPKPKPGGSGGTARPGDGNAPIPG